MSDTDFFDNSRARDLVSDTDFFDNSRERDLQRLVDEQKKRITMLEERERASLTAIAKERDAIAKERDAIAKERDTLRRDLEAMTKRYDEEHALRVDAQAVSTQRARTIDNLNGIIRDKGARIVAMQDQIDALQSECDGLRVGLAERLVTEVRKCAQGGVIIDRLRSELATALQTIAERDEYVARLQNGRDILADEIKRLQALVDDDVHGAMVRRGDALAAIIDIAEKGIS